MPASAAKIAAASLKPIEGALRDRPPAGFRGENRASAIESAGRQLPVGNEGYARSVCLDAVGCGLPTAGLHRGGYRLTKPTITLVGADTGGVGKTTLSRARLAFLARKSVLARAFDTAYPRGTL